MARTICTISDELAQAVKQSWSRNTSYWAADWSVENPAWGQCAVTALVVQDYVGGDLLGATDGSIDHYWNLVDGVEIDLTSEQFPAPPHWARTPERVCRETLLANPKTQHRYDELQARVAARLDTR